MAGNTRGCRKRDISVEILIHAAGSSKYNLLKQHFATATVNNANNKQGSGVLVLNNGCYFITWLHCTARG